MLNDSILRLALELVDLVFCKCSDKEFEELCNFHFEMAENLYDRLKKIYGDDKDVT